ncbi:hypothetical protein DFH11DRAFT_1500570 [Phellopilus nigrolimitatus]|nr:hypothetical protein DFH11DRAFT_1500570 [Phellopilus nigrolimitatus]
MSATKSPVTCHVLDSSVGKPASGVSVKLQKYRKISTSSEGSTNDDGRCLDLLTPIRESVEDSVVLHPGLYKIVFQTKEYFDALNRESFYPWVEITFEVKDPSQHYHIPLLLSPHSYTTYRGS